VVRFNAGSAVSSGELAATAFVNTNTGAASAALGWMLAEWARSGKPTMLGAASGRWRAGGDHTGGGVRHADGGDRDRAAGGVICYYAVSLKPKLGYDDALDVVGVHMVGGTVGALLTGVFATKDVNSAIPASRWAGWRPL